MNLVSCVLIPVLLFGTGISKAEITPVDAIPLAVTFGRWITKDDHKVYYVRVEASGNSVDDAKNRALKIAVQQAIGSVLLDETEVINRSRVNSEMAMYSAGLVEKYEIKDKIVGISETTLTVDVWVSSSKLADMLVPAGKSDGIIDGTRLAALEKSRAEEQKTGDQLIQIVANDFPRRALKIDIKNSQVLNYDRESKLLINVKIGWNPEYITGLVEALDRTMNTGSKDSRSVVSVKIPGKYFVHFSGYTDNIKQQKLRDRFLDSRPTVHLSIFDETSQHILYQGCYNINIDDGFVETRGSNNLHINGNYSNSLTLEVDNVSYENMKKIKVNIDTESQCLSNT
jgi:hypothetical protein